MNLFAMSGLLIGIFCAILGVLSFAKAKKTLHYIWGLFSFSVALWGFGSYGIGLANYPESAIWWWKIGYIGVIFIPVFFTHFVYKFLELSKKWLIKLIYFFGFIFSIADLFSNLFIGNVQFLFNQFYYISAPTILYDIFVLGFITFIFYSHILLLKAYRESRGIKKSQIKYFLIATIPGFAAGSLEFLPVYGIPVYPYFHFVIIFSPFCVSYAILRYRLMDIRIITRKIFIYILSAGFAYGIFYFLAWLYSSFFGGIFNKTSYILGLFIAPIFSVSFLWFYSLIQKIANKYLFFSLYSSQETMAKLTDELTNSIDLSKIVDSIADSIKNAMQLDRAGILLVDQGDGTIKYKIAKVIGFNETNGISLVQDNFLTQYLQKTQKPLVRDELQMIAKDLSDPNERQSFNQLSENMKRIEASLCLPMIISNKLIGIIVLGNKISGDAYTNEDLNLLSTLSKQAAIAVDNARLYSKVQDFSKTLQQKVDEQTKEIKEAYEVEKQAHEELKRTDEVKTQFLVITNHHLRTPLTAINWYTDLLLSGKRGKFSPKSKEIIDRIKTSTTDEIKIVDDLLNVSQFQLGKDMINPRPEVNMEEMLKQIKNNADVEIQQKGTYIKIEKESDIPLIPADESKLKVAITNIVDNAVKYTEKGGVTIKLKTENKKLEIIIQDTGIGMNETELKNIFGKTFERGEKAQKLFATGKGIGLYLSAKIIEAHRGKVWAESAGHGKGSTLYIELPVN